MTNFNSFSNTRSNVTALNHIDNNKEVVQMTNNYQKANVQIHDNKKLRRRMMTLAQLQVLLKLTARYEYVLPMQDMTIFQASDEITRTMNAVKSGKIVERQKMFKLVVLEQRYAEIHPERYNDIHSRYSA